VPDLLMRPPAEGTAAPAATLDAHVATPVTAQPIAAPPPPLAPGADSRRRMLVGAGVLLLALVIALLMLRFAS